MLCSVDQTRGDLIATCRQCAKFVVSCQVRGPQTGMQAIFTRSFARSKLHLRSAATVRLPRLGQVEP